MNSIFIVWNKISPRERELTLKCFFIMSDIDFILYLPGGTHIETSERFLFARAVFDESLTPLASRMFELCAEHMK